jgi:hypothetical protein
LALLLVAWALVRPWGDFPLNDDWTYAHLAKRVAETDRLLIDVPIAPNAIGQTIAGAAVVKLFGFSHTVLRVFTMALSLVGLWVIDWLVRQMVPGVRARTMVLLLLAFSPIWFYLATTFMNELHGWIPALCAVGFWFWDRKRLASKPDQVITGWVALVVGFVCGMTFWTRQFAVLLFPAALGATLLRFVLERRYRPVVRALPVIALSLLVCGASVWAFFVWAKHSGNYRPEFAVRIDNLTRVDSLTYAMEGGAILTYLTLYFLPVLALVSWRRGRELPSVSGVSTVVVFGALVFVSIAWNAKRLFETTASTDFWIGPIWHHRTFPFIVNIVWNAGIGPITLDDTFFRNGPKPEWPKWIWQGIELVVLFAAAAWSPLAARFVRYVKRMRAHYSAEIALFGALTAIGCTVAIVQAHQGEVVDRYHLPILLGLIFVVPAAIFSGEESPSRMRTIAFGLLFAPLALFTVFGTHDQFRWNQARWSLVDQALATGGTRATVQGGWEVNCWFRHEGIMDGERTCDPHCHCTHESFCCVDDTWRIGMSVDPGYARIAALQPHYWLAHGPPVILSRRGPSR